MDCPWARASPMRRACRSECVWFARIEQNEKPKWAVGLRRRPRGVSLLPLQLEKEYVVDLAA
jgi:hypothetical protein